MIIKNSKEISDKYLIITDESINDLETLYPVNMVQLYKQKKKLSKKEFNAFIDKYWDKIKKKYKLVVVIGSELFKFFTGVKRAGNYHTEMYEYDGVTIIQGVKYQNSWLDKNKYLYNISLDTIDRFFYNKEPVRIWEYIEPEKVKYYV